MVQPIAHLFLSYSHSDRVFARKLRKYLAAQQFDVWLDETELRAGDSIQGRVEHAIATAGYVLVVLSPRSVTSTFVQEELRTAMSKQRRDERRFVIPLLARPCEIPAFLWDRLYIDFTKRSQFDRSFLKLLEAVDPAFDEARANSVPRTPLIEEVFSQLEKDPDLLESVNTFKSMALTRYLTEFSAARRESDFLSRFSIILSVLSNASHLSNFRLNNFVLLMSFYGVMKNGSHITRDQWSFLHGITVDNAITVQFRELSLFFA